MQPTSTFSLWTATSLLSLGLGLGCSSLPHQNDLAREQIARDIQDRGLDPKQVILPFGLTDEMRSWALATAPLTHRPEERLELLRERLLNPQHMSLEYQWGYTGTAIEVFEQRKANCLAFTNLFVGMAREVDVPVYFVAVLDAETYRRFGDLVVISDHIAVGYGPQTDRLIYDFSERTDLDYRFVQRVSDLTAIAMFHSNRGAEALQAGQVSQSVQWLTTATIIDPELANAWVNLGVALRRSGDLSNAEQAYKRALEVNPRLSSAYQNLSALLRLQGRDEEALAFEQTLRDAGTRNPYTYLTLGDLSLRSGRVEEAQRFYRRAVNLSADDPDCLAALGHAAVATGDLRTARRMLKKAQKIDRDSERTRTLAKLVSSETG